MNQIKKSDWQTHNIIKLSLLPIQDTIMTQAGHSTKTALSQYGQDPQSQQDIPTPLLLSHCAASKLWHLVLMKSFGINKKEADTSGMSLTLATSLRYSFLLLFLSLPHFFFLLVLFHHVLTFFFFSLFPSWCFTSS